MKLYWIKQSLMTDTKTQGNQAVGQLALRIDNDVKTTDNVSNKGCMLHNLSKVVAAS